MPRAKRAFRWSSDVHYAGYVLGFGGIFWTARFNWAACILLGGAVGIILISHLVASRLEVDGTTEMARANGSGGGGAVGFRERACCQRAGRRIVPAIRGSRTGNIGVCVGFGSGVGDN